MAGASANQPPRLLGKRAIDSILEWILSSSVGFPIQNLLPDAVAQQTDC